MKKTILFLAFLVTSIFNCSAQYAKLFDFSDTAGKWPRGTLICDETFLYGMARYGGTYNCGVIFKMKFDGTGYSKLFDFDSLNGKNPLNSLVNDGTFLYGMTPSGGTHNMGTIFKIKPDGTSFSTLLNFDGANGKDPLGSLTLEGEFLYGAAAGGGTGSDGTLFKIMKDGTGYTKLFDFNTVNGKAPCSSFYSDGTFLYGFTVLGGTHNDGTLFKIKPDGTEFSKLFNFDTVNGIRPNGPPVFDGSFFYCSTFLGGSNGLGTIFKIRPDGTDNTVLLNFDGTNGSLPQDCPLIFVDAFLYGMTTFGGEHGLGTAFKIKPDGTLYSSLLDFDYLNGDDPSAAFVFHGSYMYAMVNGGYPDYYGNIFELAPPFGAEISENTNSESKMESNIYPNPTTGIFQLSIGNRPLKSNTEISIYNLIGEKIYSKDDNSSDNILTINLSDQANGIFFVQLKIGIGIVTKKIIIDK